MENTLEKREMADKIRSLIDLLNNKIAEASSLDLNVQITQLPSTLESKVCVMISQTTIL